MGAEIVCRLGTDASGVFVSSLCMDLDAKTPKAVELAVNACNLPVPMREHDPNHYVKAFRKKLIDVKSRVRINNVLPPLTQKRLGDEVAIALHQHRGTPKLKHAILNVLEHGFNNHSHCREFFDCPCAPDEHGVVHRTKSSYKGGFWLNEVGGVEGVTKLRELLNATFNSCTTSQHMDALNHQHTTNVCESMNSLHASLHPKRRDLSRSTMGRLLHLLSAARFNDGICQTTEEVLMRCGLQLERVGKLVLTKVDSARDRDARYKSSLHAKRNRKKRKEQRAVRDGKDTQSEYGPGIALEVDALDVEEEEVSTCVSVAPVAGTSQPAVSNVTRAASAAPVNRKRGRQPGVPVKCSYCHMQGHDRRVCPKRKAETQATIA